MNPNFIRAGGIFGFLGVALGAFGAHALKDILGELLPTWQTAVQYHLVHSLALVLVGILLKDDTSQVLRWAGRLFVAGIVLFSGSLYVLALTKIKVLGAITPLGGVAFLTGWVLLAISPRTQPSITPS